MNVVLVGGESAGLEMLRRLRSSPHRLIAIIAEPSPPGFAGVSVWNVAQHLGCETWPAELVKSAGLAEQLRSRNVDILLNVYSLYRIHEVVLAAPRLGAFNLHPGPLPRYAGLNSVSWAIFRGENTHGVTVHKMSPEVDAGPVVYQSFFPIGAADTALSVGLKCVQEGISLMSRLLQVAGEGEVDIPLVPQDLTKRECFGREVPEQGQISWSWPARKVVDFVRACDYFPFSSPWGHPRTRLGAQEFALVKASRTGIPCQVPPGKVGDSVGSGVYVACQDEWILASKLRVDHKYLPAGEFLSSGDDLAG
jgi:methionyl-tRNA formyltransferase